MNNIKTIADFKRAMTIGSYWEAVHEYTDENPTPPRSLGIRKVGKIQTNRFAFTTDRNTLSVIQFILCNLKKEFSTEDNGNIVVITTSFCRLKYREIT